MLNVPRSCRAYSISSVSLVTISQGTAGDPVSCPQLSKAPGVPPSSLACGPDKFELSEFYTDMACKLCTFKFTGMCNGSFHYSSCCRPCIRVPIRAPSTPLSIHHGRSTPLSSDLHSTFTLCVGCLYFRSLCAHIFSGTYNFNGPQCSSALPTELPLLCNCCHT